MTIQKKGASKMDWIKNTVWDSIVVFTVLPVCLIILLTALKEIKEKYFDEEDEEETQVKDRYHGEGL